MNAGRNRIAKQREFQAKQADELAMEHLRRLMTVRVFVRRLPRVLWFVGRVPESLERHEQVADALGIDKVTDGALVDSDRIGTHWLLVEGK